MPTQPNLLVFNQVKKQPLVFFDAAILGETQQDFAWQIQKR